MLWDGVKGEKTGKHSGLYFAASSRDFRRFPEHLTDTALSSKLSESQKKEEFTVFGLSWLYQKLTQ